MNYYGYIAEKKAFYFLGHSPVSCPKTTLHYNIILCPEIYYNF